MKVQQWMLTAALVAIPALAAAQAQTTTTTPQGGTTTTTAPDNTTTTQTPQTQTTTRDVDFDDLDSNPGGWFASAHVGSDFGQEADGNSVDFGGALGYTSGWFGAEFLAGFTPNFQLRNNIFVEEPSINSYMFNLMAGVPIGADKNWQPFVSGGLGALTLRSDAIAGDENDFEETFDPDDSQLGANIGFGVMGFAGNVGVRADVRYFRGFSDDSVEDALNLDPGTIDDDTSPGSQAASGILSGLDFWRANIGLAFRW
jgi:hypothetical protein